MSSLRLPQALVSRLGADAGEAAFRHELMEEQFRILPEVLARIGGR
ncbi:hypothetical protein [Phenylobacterium sp.]